MSDTTERAADDFFPGCAEMMTEIGRERGFGAMGRAQFDAQAGPTGAFFVGDPEMVARKILYVDDVLGGISRISLQMTNVMLPHDRMMRGIELLGTGVVPLVRKAVARRGETVRV